MPSTPASRLLSNHEPNPREHCNCIILRSRLEGLKDAGIKEDDENNHNKSDKAFPSKDEHHEKNESERSKESKEPQPFSLTPYMPHLPFP